MTHDASRPTFGPFGSFLMAIALGLSGCAGLAYQVVWFRQLARDLGATAPAAAVVLVAFMGGLGGGAFLAARVGDRMSPRRALFGYACLEVAIALVALCTPWIFGMASVVHDALLELTGPSQAVRTAIRACSSGVALLPATLLMGATLPLMMRALRGGEALASRTFGWLYAANNVGALLGTALAGFWLLRAFGEAWSLRLAAAASVMAGVLAATRARAVSDFESEPAADAAPTLAIKGKAAWSVLAAAAGTGFTVLGYEVLWSRTLGPLLGSTTYAFSAMLMAVLLGLAVGAALGARWGDAVPHPLVAATLLSSLTALLALTTYRWFSDVVAPTLYLMDHAKSEVGRLFWVPFGVSLVLVLPATICSGAVLPLGVRALARNGEARSTGMAYAANTAGSLAGALLTGLILIPTIGSRSAGAVIATIGGALAALAALSLGKRLPLLALFTTIVLAVTQPPLELVLFWGGVHMMAPANRRLLATHGPETRLVGSEVLYAAEGANTTVLVERRWGRRAFFVDGKPEASESIMDMRNQYLLGHLPALLAGSVKRSLVVGLGSGMTAGALTHYGDVDVAELSAVVPGATRIFADLNHGVVDHPRAHIFIEDGRAFLRRTRHRYDVITVDPIHPYVAGASALYTRDYFERVKARLSPHGVVSHWLPLYQLSATDVRGVLRSFLDVFPDAIVYNSDRDAILIGNAGPVLPTGARFEAGFSNPQIRADLARVLIDTPEQLASLAACRPATLRKMVGNTPPITDDRTWIEYTAPFSFQNPSRENLADLIAVREHSVGDEETNTARRATTALLKDATAETREQAQMHLDEALRVLPGLREAEWRRSERY